MDSFYFGHHCEHILSNYSAQQGDVQAKAIEYSAVDPADLRVPPSDPRSQPKRGIHGESTVDSFVPPLDPHGLESDLFSTLPSSYVLEFEEQDYFFKIEKDEQVLDSINIVQGPDVVFATGQDGKSVPLAMIIIQVRSIQGKGTARYFRALLDTGSNVSLAHSRVLPQGTQMDILKEMKLVSMAAGLMSPSGLLTIDGLRLPEFNRNAVIQSHEF